MNVITIKDGKNKINYLYESYWQGNIKNNRIKRIADINNVEFPNPVPYLGYWEKEIFLKKLKIVEKNSNFEEYDALSKHNNCLICGYKEKCKLYTNNNIRWESILIHYINIHNIKPSDEFIDFILRMDISNNKIGRVKGNIKSNLKNDNKTYLKIKKNQLLILDALLYYGGKKIYGHKKDNNYRFSEHSGLLHFEKNKLNKIIVFANANQVDEFDTEIYFPNENKDLMKYEYFYHTHPPTPNIGSRVNEKILYEIPSINDILHFIDHYNFGKAKGSIVLAPEGLYIIRKYTNDNKKIKINEDTLFELFNNEHYKYQTEAIERFYPFDDEKFYRIIAQDMTMINKINNLLKEFNLWIDYFPRFKDTDGYWHINTIYIPI